MRLWTWLRAKRAAYAFWCTCCRLRQARTDGFCSDECADEWIDRTAW